MEPSTPPLNQPDQPSGAPPVPATPPAAPVVPQPASQPLPAPAVPPVTPAVPPVAPPAPVSVPVAPVTDDFGKLQKIVIVEDNASLADIYSTRLTLLGYKCFVAYDGLAALATIQQEMPDLVLLDLMVPKIAGDQILETMRASSWGKDIKVQIISNLNEADAPAGLRAQGIEGYAVKANLSNDQLDQLVDNILKPAGQTEDIVLEAKEPPIQPLN